jgi:hypothetical protein
VDGPVALTQLAMAYAWLGDNDAVIERLTYLAKFQSGPDYGQLKFDPAWAASRTKACWSDEMTLGGMTVVCGMLRLFRRG